MPSKMMVVGLLSHMGLKPIWHRDHEIEITHSRGTSFVFSKQPKNDPTELVLKCFSHQIHYYLRTASLWWSVTCKEYFHSFGM